MNDLEATLVQAEVVRAVDSIVVPRSALELPVLPRRRPLASRIPAFVVSALVLASLVAAIVILREDRVVPAAPSAGPSMPASAALGPEFTFSGGNMTFCGPFVSYRAPTTTRSGELRIGGTAFVLPWVPDPDQKVEPDVVPGTWSCMVGAVASSPREVQLTFNLLRDFDVHAASPAERTSHVENAKACGPITDVSVSDLPSGGYISIAGTKFLLGGIRQPGQGVQLPAPATLRVGASVCISGATFDQQGRQTYNVTGGRAEIP